jgi:group I intron endonuclease
MTIKYKSGVYLITNLVNNKYYVGSSCNLNRRITEHKRKLLQNKHENPVLQASVNKYGLVNFVFSVLLYCSKFDLLLYEQRIIDKYKPEYNICQIAGNTLGYKHTSETKNKIKLAVLGKKHSESSKQKMKEVHKLNPSKGMLGKKHSEESRQKIGIKHSNKIVSEKTKLKMRLAHLGKKLSQEHRDAVNGAKIRRYANIREEKLKLDSTSISTDNI